MQQGLLFHALYAPESDAYIYQLSARLNGPLRLDEFANAWQRTVDRHTILRTFFSWDGLKQPVQTAIDQITFKVQELDWRTLSSAAQQEQLTAVMDADRRKPFDLSRAPLMRAILIRLSNESCYFIWSHHHLILDGWSISLVLQDVAAVYERLCAIGTLPSLHKVRPYVDYIDWLQQQDASRAETFWRAMFTAPLPAVKLISRVPLSVEQYRAETFQLHRQTTLSLISVARQHQLTLSTVIHGVWAILLARYNATDDVVFGTVVSGRPAILAGIESMVGLFINTLPMRVRLRPSDSLLDWFRELQLSAAAAREFQYTPLSSVQAYASCPAGSSLFDSVVSFDNYPPCGLLRRGLSDVQLDDIRDEIHSHYVVALKVVPGDELSLTLSYDSSRLYSSTAAGILRDIAGVLTRISIQPHVRLRELISSSGNVARGRPLVLMPFDEPFTLN